MKSTLYFDHSATTPTRKEVVEAMLPFFESFWGNPSSLYLKGREANRALEKAREEVASLIKAPSAESIIFTSGGTESNNMAIKGVAFSLRDRGKHIITSQIEHPSVLEPLAWLESEGWQVTYLPVDREGMVSVEDLKKAISSETVLVSIIHGNNEVGTLQSLEALGEIAHKHEVLFHVDAVQTVGKLPLNMESLPVDMLSCSAHKLYGPKGVGFLYANERARNIITPLLQGGGQQGGLRSGTENLPGIVGLSKAMELAYLQHKEVVRHLYSLQEKFIDGVMEEIPGAKLNGPRNVRERVPGNVSFSFPSIEGESLVLRFDLEGIAVSSGSACHSRHITGSHVLRAMGKTEEEAKSSLRFSFGYENSPEDVERVLEMLPKILKKAGYFRNQPVVTNYTR